MIKIATAQIDVIPGNIRENWKQTEEEIRMAREKGAHILVLPEMCLTGYLIGDLWDQSAFLRECEAYNEKIAAAARGMTILWGSCAIDWEKTNDDGRPRKYNAAFAAADGHFLVPENGSHPYVIKTLLPNYRCFDDRRYFTSLRQKAMEENLPVEDALTPFLLPAGEETIRAGVLLCEDSWDENYSLSPMSILAKKNISLFFNLSASPFTLGKNEKRHRMLGAALSKLHIPMVYVNQRGLQNNGKTCYTFDGMTAAYDREGRLTAEARPYEEPRCFFLFDREHGNLIPETPMDPFRDSLLLPALRYGVKKFLSSIHVDRVVIGVSGGIDSAVNAALYRSVLPEGHLLLVNTPTRFNSEMTKGLAKKLADNLESPYLTIPIGSFIDETAAALEGLPVGSGNIHLTGFMKENMQARDRSSRILSALSAAFGGIFTCNANKTEMTVGYGTLYGDLAGALAATADLWKYQIYELGRALNQWYGKDVIPEGIFTVKPSAELSENQDVTKGLGDPLIYEYHDYLLKSFIEPWQRNTPEDILAWYAEGNLEEHLGCQVKVKDLFLTNADFIKDLERWWNLFAGFAVAKRIQAPPLIAISRRPYGYDLRESQVRPYYTDRYLEMKKRLLPAES
ncbi:NAD(+) synthase [uncultured Dialister sp.]|uniref:NAD(+) synthase n=1 Tax=uncultured Dialister sp. TaxID=278064 RepID=UPI0025CC34E4|nr:NAD(+) synthase [uncultured Dialister sp.]